MQRAWTEYDLKEMWKSPNGTIRAILRRNGIPCTDRCERHRAVCEELEESRSRLQDMHMVMYTKASEMKIPGAGKVELVYTAEDGSETRELDT